MIEITLAFVTQTHDAYFSMIIIIDLCINQDGLDYSVITNNLQYSVAYYNKYLFLFLVHALCGWEEDFLIIVAQETKMKDTFP